MELLTEQKAAEVMKCTVAALRRWRRERRGPRFVKLGRLIRYNIADIEAYVEHPGSCPAWAQVLDDYCEKPVTIPAPVLEAAIPEPAVGSMCTQ
ncbi:MAG TPA: helix-turn-helix domain-containing protein, partial [Acidobacteriota bacterium]|nr:helix-turn-helix domain-containing protein [Acidobacteriota bacterium]